MQNRSLALSPALTEKLDFQWARVVKGLQPAKMAVRPSAASMLCSSHCSVIRHARQIYA